MSYALILAGLSLYAAWRARRARVYAALATAPESVWLRDEAEIDPEGSS